MSRKRASSTPSPQIRGESRRQVSPERLDQIQVFLLGNLDDGALLVPVGAIPPVQKMVPVLIRGNVERGLFQHHVASQPRGDIDPNQGLHMVPVFPGVPAWAGFRFSDLNVTGLGMTLLG